MKNSVPDVEDMNITFCAECAEVMDDLPAVDSDSMHRHSDCKPRPNTPALDKQRTLTMHESVEAAVFEQDREILDHPFYDHLQELAGDDRFRKLLAQEEDGES